LDTTALIDFSKGREPAYSQLRTWIASEDLVAVCSITVAEFYAGLSADEAQRWEEFISLLAYFDLSPRAAMHAGQDRYSFARQGRTVTITDLLIAAAAREHKAILVTANVKDYTMTGISIFPLL
jgi:predicted nucleic acid-binding protein